ncbi:hypothetical protein C4K40_3173 [Pseudomonas sp. CMR5c]|nr:hypothetical protein C4K40_3173 [Pseudomonas sp. CMR5c]
MNFRRLLEEYELASGILETAHFKMRSNLFGVSLDTQYQT